MANDEQRTMSIWGPLGVAAASVAQISAGVHLQACSPGILTVVGQSLIREGISDIVFAIVRALNGTFSWTEYRKQKPTKILLTTVCVGAEMWIQGGARNAFRRWTVQKVVRTVGEASTHAVTVFIMAKALRKAEDLMFENFHEKITAIIDYIFVCEFENIQAYIRDLFRLDSSNAENLISCAFRDVAGRANAGVVFVSKLVELGIQFWSNTTARGFRNRKMNCVKFVTAEATYVTVSCLFARNFMRSLQEALATCRRNQPSQRTSQQADPEIVEEFIAKFKRRITAFVARKVGEQFRRGLLLASAQSFVPGLIADAFDKAGF